MSFLGQYIRACGLCSKDRVDTKEAGNASKLQVQTIETQACNWEREAEVKAKQ